MFPSPQNPSTGLPTNNPQRKFNTAALNMEFTKTHYEDLDTSRLEALSESPDIETGWKQGGSYAIRRFPKCSDISQGNQSQKFKNNEDIPPPTRDEVDKAIQRLTNNKSAGATSIPTKFLILDKDNKL
uniref:Uncharacterized protein n=1 Tax=Megaselia scalaris TaxID=36166 RepID=T1GSA0_MEGSC